MPKKKKKTGKKKKRTPKSKQTSRSQVSMKKSQTVELGFKHHQAGNLPEAEKYYREALADDPNNSDAYHFLGIIANQVGKNEAAIDFIEKALATNPNNDIAHNNLGIALERTGRVDEAIESFQNALALNPDLSETYNSLGNVLNSAGRVEEAISSYKKALALNPDFADVFNNIAIALEKTNRLDEAISNYRKALSLQPEFVAVHNNLGNALSKTGRLDEAIQCYNKAISLKPDFVDAYNNLGNMFEKKGKLDEAIETYQKALAINPEYADAYNNLGIALKDADRLDEAIDYFSNAVKFRPDFAEAYNNLGNVFEKLGRSDDAIKSYTKAISIKPEYAQAHCNLGIELEKIGRLEEAIASFRKTISLKPEHIEAHRYLTKSKKFTRYDDDIAAMESLYQQADLSNEDKMYLCFAIGKAYEDLAMSDKSFSFIFKANRLKRSSYDYSISEDRAMFNIIKEIFNPDFFSSLKDTGHLDETPIFILGMPRSGSTLIEQILASHPQVFGAGELKDLALAGKDISWSRPPGESEYSSNIGMEEFKKIGAEYIQRIRTHSKEARFITDKMPHNFLHIGLIKTVLPKAKIIHSMRNPMDTGLSIYKNYFSEKNSHRYAYDLEELGQYYNLYLDIMAHWRDTLPGFVYDIQYEDLISDQEKQTRKLLDFCSLPWDEACLEFHKAERKISTASAVQVRRPLYKDSFQLWKRYEKQLEPLRKIIFGQCNA
ncbi:MAG: tetratricopeptide repeat protein [Desulfobacteraceae bacterium]|nr:tetratricopeptide repeat protein [Desulfobacteraceae bacterium]